MTAPFTTQPGDAGPWRSVQAMLRQQHVESQRVVAEAIAKRKAKNIPLDSIDDWRGQVGDILDGLEAVRERADVIALIERALGIANGGLSPLPDYEPVPDLETIEVKFRALSKADVMSMQSKLAAAQRGSDTASIFEASIEANAIAVAFLTQSLAGIRGVELEHGTLAVESLAPGSPEMPVVLAALDAAGLLAAIFNCARAYQSLLPLARRGFGLQAPSTSAPSPATNAPSSDARSSDVREEPSALTSAVRTDSSPIGVLDDTSSTVTASSLLPSTFTVSLETRPA